MNVDKQKRAIAIFNRIEGLKGKVAERMDTSAWYFTNTLQKLGTSDEYLDKAVENMNDVLKEHIDEKSEEWEKTRSLIGEYNALNIEVND